MFGIFNPLLAADSANSDPRAPAVNSPAFVQHAEANYKTAHTQLQASPTNPDAQWQFARACFDFADLSATSADRARIAQEGIAASRQLLDTNPNSVPGHYYLGMNLAQLARTKLLGALKIVGQMEQEFSTTLRLDPKYDFAGPDRNLGLLYRDAPGWPTSVGSKAKARQHLEAAVKLAPNYPENHLNLIEAELKWGDHSTAARDLKSLDTLWPAARKDPALAGPDWAAAWADWESRRTDAQKKSDATANVKGTASPRKP